MNAKNISGKIALFGILALLVIVLTVPSVSADNSGKALSDHTDFLNNAYKNGTNPIYDVTYQTYGLSFSPYINGDEDPNKGGSQITDDELEERLEIIAPYTEWIRTFGCNDDLKEAGMFAHNMGLKAAIGAWLGPNSTENQKQIDCLIDVAKDGHVDLAIVGSEVLLRGDLSEEQLISYINQVKERLAEDPSINIPVTTADVYGVLLSHPNVISAVDLVLANYYPYWEGKKIKYAIAYVHRWHQQLMDAADGKEVIVSETGWPSCGDQIGDAVPSPENARFYFLNFVSWARANDVKYFYFETFDESGKAKYEGPQGACWGIWDKKGNLKPGMQDVFDGNIMDDNRSNPIPEEPIIDFPALPELTQTNIPTFVVAGSTEPDNEVWLNGKALPPNAMDDEGNFAVPVPLVEGDNLLELVIKSGEEVIATAEKTVHFNKCFSTGGKRLIYVDSVALGEGVPALPGTIVIDLDESTLLGLIEDKHVVGISLDGSEIYTSDRTVISTDTHRELRTLPFTQDIPSNGFVVSPDRTRLYSRNERLDVPSNTLLENLPINIVTGSSWAGAPIPGGPTISDDGRYIYCCNNVLIIDTKENTVIDTGISGHFMSDIALTPDKSKILVSKYSYASGRLDVYDADTFEPLATISGLGDFAGEITFSRDGQVTVVGSAGNPAWSTNGRVTAIDLNELEKISQTTVPLADNLATSGNNEFFVSSGGSDLFHRLGIGVYVLEPSGNLVRIKTFFLGINGFKKSTEKPKNDQIRRVVFKPGVSPPEADLVISEIWKYWENCTICYNITNIGTGTAPACHNTALYVDGVEVAHDHVPVDLAPNAGYIGCFDDYTWTYTPPSGNITVCADNSETLDEVDETNNCLTNIWMCGDVNCDSKVTMSDVRKVFNRYLDPNYPLDLPWAADVNGDGKVTMSDVRKVFNRYLAPGYELNCCCEGVG
jgi:exo-beta-1,3-glucanase (GH17 family)/DNA-binding beta-propeller fold protein YncE